MIKDYLNKPSVILSLSGLFAFILYLSTMAPTIIFGDTGELVTAAYFLGIPHPHGFPTWVLIAKLFTFIPIETVAWRVNFSSVIFVSVTVYLVSLLSYGLIAKYLSKTPRWIALSVSIIVGMLLAVSSTFWSFATIAEVYGLFVLIVSLFVLSVFYYSQTKQSKWLLIISLLTGLAIGTHYLSLVLIPTLIAWIVLCHRDIFKQPKILIKIAVSFALGLSVFALLFIRTSSDIPIKWNHVESTDDVVALIQRKQFISEEGKGNYIETGVALPIAGFDSVENIAKRSIQTPIATLVGLFRGASPLLLVFAILGLVLMKFKTQKLLHNSFFVFCILTIIFAAFGYTFATNNTIEEFLATKAFPEFSIVLIVLAVLSSVSLAWIVLWCTNKWGAWAGRGVIILLVFFVAVGLLSYPNFDRSHNKVAYDHAKNILSQVDQNAVIFADKNMWVFPLLYAQSVEGLRPDVAIYDRTDSVFDDFYNISESTFASRNKIEQHRQEVESALVEKYPDRPYYLAVDKNFNENSYPLPLTQEGILYKIHGENIDIDFDASYSNILSTSWSPSHEEEQYMLVYYRVKQADKLYAQGEVEQAYEIIKQAQKLAGDNYHALTLLGIYAMNEEDYSRAANLLRQAVRVGSYDPGAYYNYGLALESLEHFDEAELQYELALEKQPVYYNAGLRIGILKLKQDNCSDAEEHFQTLPKQALMTQEVLSELSSCWKRAGNSEKANYFKGVIETN